MANGMGHELTELDQVSAVALDGVVAEMPLELQIVEKLADQRGKDFFVHGRNRCVALRVHRHQRRGDDLAVVLPHRPAKCGVARLQGSNLSSDKLLLACDSGKCGSSGGRIDFPGRATPSPPQCPSKKLFQ